MEEIQAETDHIPPRWHLRVGFIASDPVEVTALRAHLSGVLRKNPFIRPMAPTLVKSPPRGEEWIHEVKFDGWRAQVHVDDGDATMFSRTGADLTRRFRSLRPALAKIPAQQAIIDCELDRPPLSGPSGG